MLMRFDPFRELDRLTGDLWGDTRAAMPMDAYRSGDELVVHVDLPGIAADAIDLTVEKNVLTVSAARDRQPEDGVEVVASERPHGRFTRQLFLGQNLDSEHIHASYDDGVLTVRLPIADQAKPRRVEISGPKAIEATSAAA